MMVLRAGACWQLDQSWPKALGSLGLQDWQWIHERIICNYLLYSNSANSSSWDPPRISSFSQVRTFGLATGASPRPTKARRAFCFCAASASICSSAASPGFEWHPWLNQTHLVDVLRYIRWFDELGSPIFRRAHIGHGSSLRVCTKVFKDWPGNGVEEMWLNLIFSSMTRIRGHICHVRSAASNCHCYYLAGWLLPRRTGSPG